MPMTPPIGVKGNWLRPLATRCSSYSRPPASAVRAIVLGGSLAGLLAAHVLADHVDEVLVVDRDDLAHDLTGPRRGVPQSGHTHGLLAGGGRAIESILPGFGDALVARGALRSNTSRGQYLISGHLLATPAPGVNAVIASRTLIESELRRQVRAVPKITLLGGHDVVGLRVSCDRSRITGALVSRSGPHRDSAGRRELGAQVIIDATGRGSRAPAWLTRLGYPAPSESIVEAQVRYVSRLFHDQPGLHEDFDAAAAGTSPGTGRTGAAMRYERGLWAVTLSGQFGEQPPSDLEGYLAYARSLPLHSIAEIIRRCEPAGEALTYSFPASRWRHWEDRTPRPEGLVIIGDAVCSFNPVYGQGMSSAALQADRLRSLLDSGGTSDLAHRSATAFAKVVASPWAQSTGTDLRFPGQPRKPLVGRLVDRYIDRSAVVATSDVTVSTAVSRVIHMLDPATALFAPRIVLRVLGPRCVRPRLDTGSWLRPTVTRAGVLRAPARALVMVSRMVGPWWRAVAGWELIKRWPTGAPTCG